MSGVKPEVISYYKKEIQGNRIEIKRNVKITNMIDATILIHVKRGLAGFPLELQLGGEKSDREGWETLEDMRRGDQITIPIHVNLSFD